ncbi:hypothetical protein HIM_02083 [Hirsutella minnesotensis 3608]|nr:hypothetical protein HIM_02083 [Hirsutella minnesotensis 3608]
MLSRLSVLALALGSLPGCRASPASSSRGSSDRSQNADQATNATAFAVTYGYPLIQYASAVQPVLAFTGTNAIHHSRNLATPDDVSLVRPNVDTLYSRVAYDLSHNDLAITIPKIDDNRYYSFAFYDLWSNNFANLGSLTGATPGKYILRMADNEWEMGVGAEDDGSKYVGGIGCATIYGLIVPRILVRGGDNNATDLKAARAIQDQIKVEIVPRPGLRFGPRLTEQLLGEGALEQLSFESPDSLDRGSVRDLLDVVARVESFNRHINPFQAAAASKTLQEAGLSNRQYNPPEGVNHGRVKRIVGAGLAEADKLLQSYGNGWVGLPAKYSGDFGNNYAVRAAVAFRGYGQLVQSEAIYPEWRDAGTRGLSLDGEESYLVTFPSGRPPVRGFWSLTAYDGNSRLIDNPVKRHSLGDRSPITYGDGALVYGGSNRTDAFSILIQPADAAPPANWTSNWLPAPVGGGDFSVNLRLFGPANALQPGGGYVYPVVTKQKAITR